MSIQVLQSPEPFTTDGERERPILAESTAYRQLRAAMGRYMNGEINGRSYLISGHRGSGKTTLVLQVAWELRNFEQTRLTPLLVRLQGPDLLPGPKIGSRFKNGDKSGPRNGAPPKQTDSAAVEGEETSEDTGNFTRIGKSGNGSDRPPLAVAERALQQITQAIYRALCEEVADAFSHRLTERRDHSTAQIEGEGSELVARFRLALDQAPSPAELREFYRIAGILDQGVLALDGSDHQPDQGMRELAALSAASSAFRVVVGQVSSSKKEGRTERTEQKRTLALDVSIRDLVQQVLVLALGGAIGTGALAAGEGGLVAGGLAVGTALVAIMLMRFASSRKSAQSSLEEYTFIRDYTSSTLERELPVLIQRLKAAGIAPVFMVDELDKVQWLQRDMRTVVSQLKQFVSGRAFFCFLTDRDYFEHLRDRSLREPYPHEHTFFTDRLLVLFRPADLHEYLEKILDVEGNDQDDEIHKELLTFLLLHRSKLHPVDLQRELRRYGGDGRQLYVPSLSQPQNWSLNKDEALPLNRGIRLTIMVQLAIEVLLDREPLRSRLEQDPHFAQPVYDALYYVSRIWEEGRDEGGELEHTGILDLRQESFHRYLAARMNPNRPLLLDHDEDVGKSFSEERSGVLQLPLNARDEAFLLEQVKRLVELLVDPRRLAEELNRQPLSYKKATAARDSIPAGDGNGLVLEDGSESDQYWFAFDPYGRRLRAVEPETGEKIAGVRAERLPDAAEVEEWIETVTLLDRELYDLTGLTLSNYAGFHVLSAVPTWTQVEEAMARLRHFVRGGEAYELMWDDSETLTLYLQQLKSRLGVLLLTILYGAVVGRAASHLQDLIERRAEGIRVLTEGLGFDRFREVPALMKELERYGSTVNPPFDADSEVEMDADRPKVWLEHLKMLLGRSDAPYSPRDVELNTKDSWSKWKQRLERRVVAGRRDEVEISEYDLWCKVANLGPGSLLRVDLDKMTLAEWTAVLLEGMKTGQGEPGGWLAVAALVELGLGRLAMEWIEKHDAKATSFDETAQGWIRRMRYSRPRALEGCRWAIILRSSPGALTESWRPSSRYGAISLPAEMGDTEIASLLEELLPASIPPVVTTELPEPVAAQEAFKRIWELTGGDVPNFGLKRRARDPDEGFEGRGMIIGANSLDEAMEQALRQVGLSSQVS